MIRQEVRDDVVVLTLDRPDRRNAVDTATCLALAEAVSGVSDRTRAVVLTGAGPVFCAGADLTVVYDGGLRDALGAALRALVASTVPVLAAINGPAIGAGTQLAMACDLRVADPAARFAVPTARNALAVDLWTIRRLARLAGDGTASAVLVGGASVDADLALSRGLVDRVAAPGAALDETLAWAGEVAGFAPLSVRYAKRVLAEGSPTTAVPGDAELLAAFDACWASADVVEGRAARDERRPPRFRGV